MTAPNVIWIVGPWDWARCVPCGGTGETPTVTTMTAPLICPYCDGEGGQVRPAARI